MALTYGGAKLASCFLLAPMAGYTDIAFRLLCRKRGAAMCFTEFSNARALVRGVGKGWGLVKTCKQEMPVGIQIFGDDALEMAKAVRMINGSIETGEICASCIDLNFGCPSGSVVRAGAGSALLRKPETMAEIASACVKASSLPVTAKIRVGWSSDNAVGFAKQLEKAGVEGITIHWRTATEGRRRQKGWECLVKVKGAVSIPVVANGGAHTPGLAVKMLHESRCDGVMIASGALGNPGIFTRANALFPCKKGLPIGTNSTEGLGAGLPGGMPAKGRGSEALGKEAASPGIWGERLSDFKEYYSLAEKFGVLSEKRLRAHALEFVKGFPGASKIRRELNAVKGVEGIVRILEEC